MKPVIGEADAGRGGFTLVEAVVVVALLGILVALAAPSYRAFLLRAHRTDAAAQLMEVAVCQERIRAAGGAYDTDRCLPPGDARYRFEYRGETDPHGDYYLVAAAPRGAQAADRCGALLLDALGVRSASDPAADANRCWAGR